MHTAAFGNEEYSVSERNFPGFFSSAPLMRVIKASMLSEAASPSVVFGLKTIPAYTYFNM